MGVVIGIDVGGSTTKIVGFKEENGEKKALMPLFVSANDPITSVYGAFGKFTHENGLSLKDIDKVMMTGVGATFVTKDLYDLPCSHVSEFDSIGLGGMYLSGLSECLVVSLGTGTAIVHASKEKGICYLGGTGVGGGTLMGLSKLLLKADNIDHIVEMADEGALSNIDLCIGDIAAQRSMGRMPADLTASNFGNVSDLATKSDIARGILNLVFETVGMVAIFAARSRGVRDIVLTGNLTQLAFCRQKAEYFNGLEEAYGVHFLIPDLAQFSTVIGTALQG
ncbi:MAG: type II pantothenate kinase [Clostridia bacterium]|nr:type II pantothenate kinase [Clostridia bacterium]